MFENIHKKQACVDTYHKFLALKMIRTPNCEYKMIESRMQSNFEMSVSGITHATVP